jgi:CRISPR-associated protein Csb3
MQLVVTLNRMNPAEYFASLGILELLSQQDPDLLSHFEGEGNLVQFGVTSEKDIALPDLKTLPVEALPFDDQYTAPVRCSGLELNWWLDAYKQKGNALKLWAGTTTPCMMLTNYQSLMQDQFSLGFNVKTRTKSTFNLDTRASRDPLMTGYSQKDAGEPSVLYPFTEFLAAVGLQNFKPQLRPLQYFTWARPVRVNIAHAACRQDVPGLHSQGCEVRFAKVSQGMREVKSVVLLQRGIGAVV